EEGSPGRAEGRVRAREGGEEGGPGRAEGRVPAREGGEEGGQAGGQGSEEGSPRERGPGQRRGPGAREERRGAEAERLVKDGRPQEQVEAADGRLGGDTCELRDDLVAVGGECLFLPMRHQVDVELVDADRLELLQLRRGVVGAAEDAEAVDDLVGDELAVLRADS